MTELRITKRFKRFLNNLWFAYVFLGLSLLAIAVITVPPTLATMYLTEMPLTDEGVGVLIIIALAWWALVLFPVSWAWQKSYRGDRQ